MSKHKRTKIGKEYDLLNSFFITQILKRLPKFDNLWKSKIDGKLYFYDIDPDDDVQGFEEIDYRNISDVVFYIWRRSEDENQICFLFRIDDNNGNPENLSLRKILNESDYQFILSKYPDLKPLLSEDGSIDCTDFDKKEIKNIAKNLSKALKLIIIDNDK